MDAHVEKIRAEMREKMATSMPTPPPSAAGTPLQPPRSDL
jgi:hypothetical protein